jgi:hypothetical protein
MRCVGNDQVYLMNANGSNPRPLASPGPAHILAWVATGLPEGVPAKEADDQLPAAAGVLS